MFNTPKILGISMSPQKNRRLFVVATYAILVACVTIVLAVPPLRDRPTAAWILLAIVIYEVVSWEVFGKLVKPMTMPRPLEDGIARLLPPKRRDLREPDEREVAIRNAAHYRAFRVAALYGWASYFVMALRLSSPISALSVLLFALPLLTMLLTLPQAIILWTEPDVPEEVRVSR